MAIVIPEIGLDDEPITPVIRELTVTNRNPNKTIMPAPINRPGNSVGIRCESGDRQHQADRAQENQRHRQVAIGAGHATAGRLLARAACRGGCRLTEAKISGKALSMLRMPPAATAPAPM